MAVVLLALLPAIPAPALASPPRVALEWSAGASCPTDARFRTSVERMLGRSVFVDADDSPDALLRVEIDERGGSARAILTLQTRDGDIVGVRSLEQRGTCAELQGALGVIGAMVVDLRELRSALETSAPEVHDAEPGPSSDADAPAPPPPVTTAALEVDLDLSAEGTLGLQAEAGSGVAAGVSLRVRGVLVVALGGTFYPPLRGGAPPGGEFLAGLARLWACADLEVDPRVQLLPCGGLAVGGVRGRALDLALTYENEIAIAGAIGVLEVRAEPIDGWVVAARVGILVPFASGTFVAAIDGVDRVIHRPWEVVPSLALTIGARFR